MTFSEHQVHSNWNQKRESLVAFSIISSLKQTDSQMPWHMTLLKAYFVKSVQQNSLPWILPVRKKSSMGFKTNKQVATTKFYPNRFLNLQKQKQKQNKTNKQKNPDTDVFDFSYNCELEWRQKSFKSYQNVVLSGLYHHTKFERNRFVNVWLQPNVEGWFFLLFFILFIIFACLFTKSYKVGFSLLNTEWPR